MLNRILKKSDWEKTSASSGEGFASNLLDCGAKPDALLKHSMIIDIVNSLNILHETEAVILDAGSGTPPFLDAPSLLAIKHGIKIINPSSLSVKVHKIKKNSSFGFYSYITILLVLTITAFGILNLTKEIIIFNFPKNEKYIVYLYETLNNIKTIFYNIVFNF